MADERKPTLNRPEGEMRGPDAFWYALVAEQDAKIARLRRALTQFVACCETAPPTSLMTEISMAYAAAKAALEDSANE